MGYLVITWACIIALGVGFWLIGQALLKCLTAPAQVGPSFDPSIFPHASVSREVQEEADRAASMWPPFNSAHEGFAVLLEEVEELKDHVWTNQKKRDLEAMRKEAIQVAAMATRFVVDVCDGNRGRK